jgi:hypothetical protein
MARGAPFAGHPSSIEGAWHPIQGPKSPGDVALVVSKSEGRVNRRDDPRVLVREDHRQVAAAQPLDHVRGPALVAEHLEDQADAVAPRRGQEPVPRLRSHSRHLPYLFAW